MLSPAFRPVFLLASKPRPEINVLCPTRKGQWFTMQKTLREFCTMAGWHFQHRFSELLRKRHTSECISIHRLNGIFMLL